MQAQAGEQSPLGPERPSQESGTPIYEIGFDFASALASHVILESVSITLDRVEKAHEASQDFLVEASLRRLDVYSLILPDLATKRLEELEITPKSIRSLKARWLALNGRTPNYDLGPFDGLGVRGLQLVLNYAEEVLQPKLAVLVAAEELAEAEISAGEVFMNFIGMTDLMQLNGGESPTGFTLATSVAEERVIHQAMQRARMAAEPVRSLMVAARSGRLSTEQDAQYRAELQVFEDELQSFADTLRRSLAHH